MKRYNRLPSHKVVIIGDGACGKTCLVGRYTDNKFSDEYLTTVGASFAVKKVTIERETDDDYDFNMTIWDLAGQPRFDFIRDNYYFGAHAAMIVYDVTRMSTFANIENWVNEMRSSIDERIPMILVGNKIDVGPARKVDSDVGIDVMNEYDMNGYIETSALDNINVNEAFQCLASSIFYPNMDKRIILSDQ